MVKTQRQKQRPINMQRPINKQSRIKKQSLLLCALCLLGCWVVSVHAVDITVNGFFKGGAILVIDGNYRLLRVGESSPEGVELIAADDKSATFKFGNEEKTLGINRSISTQFTTPEKSEVRIASSYGGHYVTPGRINGLAVEFLVDTGATTVAMNLPTAKALGLNYRAGAPVNITTANGEATAYQLMLDSVRVGDVEVRHVAAMVSMGDFPAEILLGNSFLSRVNLRRENGVLVLESRFAGSDSR